MGTTHLPTLDVLPIVVDPQLPRLAAPSAVQKSLARHEQGKVEATGGVFHFLLELNWFGGGDGGTLTDVCTDTQLSHVVLSHPISTVLCRVVRS